MNESKMWQYLQPKLKVLHPIRIENVLSYRGIPDVNYAFGWIELKYIKDYPKRPTTPVRIRHYTSLQKNFLCRRLRMGENMFVLLRVKNDWFLFADEYSFSILGEMTKSKMIERAALYCENRLDIERLLTWLDPLNYRDRNN